jgi:DNA primase
VIPPAFIQDLLSRTDIVEVVGRHVELRKAGINHKGLCPFHGEKTPSFTVSATRQTYHCFGCGAHGNAIGFLIEHGGLGFIDAVRDLAQHVGMTVPEDDASPQERAQAAQLRERQATLTETLARAAAHYRAQLKTSPRAIDYLKRRGLTGEIAARFGLGYAPDGWRSLASAFARYDDPLLEESGLVIAQGEDEAERKRYDRFRDRIMFPIRSVPGEVIGFGGRVLDQGEPKYLNSPETPVFSKGRELYGLHEARQALRERGHALVVEGYMDVVALAQHGFANAVATLGTACTAEHVHKLFRFTDAVVFSFDGDAAGRRAARRALEAALPHASDTRSVRFLFLPPEHDPDSYVREFGAAAFAACIEQAVPLSRQLVEAARDGCELAQAEGRARFLAAAKPLWQALPDGALRRQILGDIARVGQIETGELAALWGGTTGRPDAPAARPSHAPIRGTAGPTRRPPARPRPMDPATQALRLLLLHSDWWQQLTSDDHELLHSLPAPHGALFTWLERQLGDRGAASWAVLEAALAEHEHAAAARDAMSAMAIEDVVTPDDLCTVVQRLWVGRLSAEAAALAEQAASDPEALRQLKPVRERLDALKRSLDAARREAASP